MIAVGCGLTVGDVVTVGEGAGIGVSVGAAVAVAVDDGDGCCADPLPPRTISAVQKARSATVKNKPHLDDIQFLLINEPPAPQA